MLQKLHRQVVHSRRCRVLGQHIQGLFPPRATVLDLGCGDGQLAGFLQEQRPDITITGLDVIPRETCRIPVAMYDGQTIPLADQQVDFVLLVDVLHHCDDPFAVLQEALRVSRMGIVVKDHYCDSGRARMILRFMDWVGNASYGVALPFNYWPRHRWTEATHSLGLATSALLTDLRIYPWWADWLFGRGLHFVACWTRSAADGNSEQTTCEANAAVPTL